MSALEVVLFDRSGPTRCPFCHDALTRDGAAAAATLLRCSGCGTATHDECAALNRGRCCVHGCTGRLGASDGAATVRFALAVRSPASPPARAVEAAARWLGLPAYDAALRLRAQLPLVLRYVERADVAPALAELCGAGLTAFAVEAAVLADASQREVRRVVEWGRERVVLELGPGSARHVLDLNAPRRVVLAQAIDARQVDQRAGWKRSPSHEERRRSAGLGPHGPLRRAAPQVYVYEQGEASSQPPLVFERGLLRDYRFLGAGMLPSGEDNFRLLEERLTGGARTVTHALLRARDGEFRPRRSARARHLLSNRAWVLATSRLVALAQAAPAPDARGPTAGPAGPPSCGGTPPR